MISGLNFDTQIAAFYLRNNRSTRQKSLRCFPSCGIKGHISGGFCGKPLKVTIDLKRDDPSHSLDITEYIFIAEIRPISQAKISNEKVILKSYVLDQIRTKYEKQDSNNGELFMADVKLLSYSIDIAALELSFNSQHCSWDYSWKSNRWSGPQEQHTVDIIVLKSISVSEFAVVSYTSSTPFIILSSHKKPPPSSKKLSQEDGLTTKKVKTKSDLPSINKLKRDHYSMSNSNPDSGGSSYYPKTNDIIYPISGSSKQHMSNISDLINAVPGLAAYNNNNSSNDSNVLKPESSDNMSSICPVSVVSSVNRNIYYQPPIHHFKQSADGKSMKLAPVVDNATNYIPSLHHYNSNVKGLISTTITTNTNYNTTTTGCGSQIDPHDSLKEGALALIQLFVSQPKSHDNDIEDHPTKYLERLTQPTTTSTTAVAALMSNSNTTTNPIISYTNNSNNCTSDPNVIHKITKLRSNVYGDYDNHLNNIPATSNEYFNHNHNPNILENNISPSRSQSYQYINPLQTTSTHQHQQHHHHIVENNVQRNKKIETFPTDIIYNPNTTTIHINNNHQEVNSNTTDTSSSHLFNNHQYTNSSHSNATNTIIYSSKKKVQKVQYHDKEDLILELPLRQ